MIVGVPREIKEEEYRVALTPTGVRELIKEGHQVLIEKGAGEESGFPDDDYRKAGAQIRDAEQVWSKSELICKVKEPLKAEYKYLSKGKAIFTFLHLASSPELVEELQRKEVAAFAYETLTVDGKLPLLEPMSEIAGKMAPFVGSFYLQKTFGGSGVLPMGVAAVQTAKVLIIGAGNVGFNAARVAYGMGMEVTILNRGIDRLKKIEEYFSGRIKTLILNEENLLKEIVEKDIVVGCILIPGGKPPIYIKKDMLPLMKKGAVIVDVSVDQGGITETIKPTTHKTPIYLVDHIVHYGVSNMPGAFPKTSTMALSNATLPYIIKMASIGIKNSCKDETLKTALNIFNGEIINERLKKDLGIG